MKTWIKLGRCAVLIATLLILAMNLPAQAEGPVTPIPSAPTSLPAFIGKAAKAHPLVPVQSPQNPYMAPNPFSNYHSDTWMSDTANIAGPLGRSPMVWSSNLEAARPTNRPIFICGTIAFDKYGRIVTVCSAPPAGASAMIIDPMTLEPITWLRLPAPGSFESGLGAGYVMFDNLDRAWTPMGNHLLVVGQKGGKQNTTLYLDHDYDLSNVVPAGDNIGSVVPDWKGRIWFVTRKNGVVGVLDQQTGIAQSLRLDEEIGNSFSVDQTDAFIVSVKKMYRFTAGDDNVPQVVWSAPYENIGSIKPGQISPGSGTTPTILGDGEFVAIGDNATQLHIVVYRTAAQLSAGQDRIVCQIPVFAPGRGGVEDSPIGSGRSIVVVNNYGYQLNPKTLVGTPSEPGVARVDIAADGNSCHNVWTNNTVSTGSYGAKLSTKTGLVYATTRKYDMTASAYRTPGIQVWYWTAIDFRTGATVWEQQLGTGRLFDGYWPILFLGPNGIGYNAGWGGITAIRDTR